MFQAEWSAGDALGYYGAVLSFLGTVILGALALYQNHIIKEEANKKNNVSRPLWPMIVLKTPKGWTGPKVVKEKQIEGTFRAHQVPITIDTEDDIKMLEDWLKSYKPEELFDESGKLVEASSYSDGEFAGSTEYYYDNEGRQTKMVTKHANSDMVITVFYEYDKSGNQILYGIDTGFYISKKEHFYNEENKIYRTDDYRNDELINRTEYHWEENTRYGEVYDGKEQLIAKNIYIFDDFGNLTHYG